MLLPGIADKRRDIDYIKGLLWLIVASVMPVFLVSIIATLMSIYYAIRIINADITPKLEAHGIIHGK